MAYWRHMRMGFQLLLAPLFLWGLLLAGPRLEWPVVLAFLSLHLFLYPGATAFNSAYDRDSGPVSGLAEPPPLPPGLLLFALALQAAGLILAAMAGGAFTILYLALAAIFLGYSHPAMRLKAQPVSSALSVFAGQGVLGFAGGWIAAGEPLVADPRFLAGAAVAGLTALGLYPSTQIFQVEEDRARGDRTLAVALGPARALRLGALCLILAAPAAAWAILPFGAREAALAGLGCALLAAQHRLFAARVGDGKDSFGWATGIRLQATLFFLLLTAWLLLRQGGVQ